MAGGLIVTIDSTANKVVAAQNLEVAHHHRHAGLVPPSIVPQAPQMLRSRNDGPRNKSGVTMEFDIRNLDTLFDMVDLSDGFLPGTAENRALFSAVTTAFSSVIP